MNLQDRIEWLLDQMVQGEWGDADGPDFVRLRTEDYIRDADVVIPAQWMLCTKDVPEARQRLRQMVAEMRQALDKAGGLLDTLDAAEEEAQAAGHPEWAGLIAILKSPFPLQKPEIYDPSYVPCIAVMLRDTLFDGSWDEHNHWLEEEGAEEQRRQDVPLNQSQQLFEQTYGANLTDLLFSEADRQEHEQIRREYERAGRKPLRRRRSNRTRRSKRK